MRSASQANWFVEQKERGQHSTAQHGPVWTPSCSTAPPPCYQDLSPCINDGSISETTLCLTRHPQPLTLECELLGASKLVWGCGLCGLQITDQRQGRGGAARSGWTGTAGRALLPALLPAFQAGSCSYTPVNTPGGKGPLLGCCHCGIVQQYAAS